MWREIGFLAGVALAVTLVTFVFVWAPHKAVNVKRNHFFLKVFAALDLPPWLCRMIVPKSPARDADGVASFDGVFVSTRDRRYVVSVKGLEGLLSDPKKSETFRTVCTCLTTRRVRQRSCCGCTEEGLCWAALVVWTEKQRFGALTLCFFFRLSN